MYKQRIIAIIPARSGSKGLADKNIKELNGKPLLAYSIEAAKHAKVFDTIHVSTDSRMYADIAEAYGADEPFLRDASNSKDDSSTWDAVREVIKKYAELGQRYDLCVLLQPTSPLRTSENIIEALKLYNDKRARCLTSVTEVDHPIQWCFKLDQKTCSMDDFANSPYKNCRRQELEAYYRENGAIYIVDVESINNPNFDFYSDNCVGYMMSRENSIDIDTIRDFWMAETIIKCKMRTKE